MAVDRDQLPEGIGRDVDAAGQLRRELELAGIEPLLTLDSDGMVSGGVTLRAPPEATGQFRRQVIDILMQGMPLSVSLGPAAGHPGIMQALQAAAGETAVPLNCIELAVRGRHELLEEYAGRGFVVHWRVHAMNHAAWERLWRLRSGPALHVNYAAHVIPVCPLLSAERAGAVLPGTHLQVPAGTAWLPARIDLSRFVSGRGDLDTGLLEDSLQRCLDLLDSLHAHLRWPTPQMRHDAWLNRRLAIVIAGIGSLVQKRGLDPCDFRTLEELGLLLCRLRHLLRSQSRRIAEKTRPLPALEHFDPGESLPGGRVRADWLARWRDAVDVASPRHRNLVAMSPWALFPAGQAADLRYADLLPLLRFADACAVGAAPDLSEWNAKEFKHFHCRAMAVLHQRDGGHQMAEGF